MSSMAWELGWLITADFTLCLLDPSIGQPEIDLLKAVMKNKDDTVTLIPDSFGGKPAYEFESSTSVYALVGSCQPVANFIA